jgi:hypothetical protein
MHAAEILGYPIDIRDDLVVGQARAQVGGDMIGQCIAAAGCGEVKWSRRPKP